MEKHKSFQKWELLVAGLSYPEYVPSVIIYLVTASVWWAQDLGIEIRRLAAFTPEKYKTMYIKMGVILASA